MPTFTQLRLQIPLNLTQAAKLAGIDYATLVKIERGASNVTDVKKALLLKMLNTEAGTSYTLDDMEQK